MSDSSPSKKRITIVTDAWEPQGNGVVRVLRDRKRVLENMGYKVNMITPQDFHTFPLPFYKEIEVAYLKRGVGLTDIAQKPSLLKLSDVIGEKLKEQRPDYIHIATAAEGTLGPAAVKFCKDNGLHFTTEMHTRLPEFAAEYIATWAGDRSKSPTRKIIYSWARSHHKDAERTLVPSGSMREELEEHAFNKVVVCPHGVDTNLFKPGKSHVLGHLGEGPKFVYVGRVAVEKGIEEFLKLELPGIKVVVGDGPKEVRERLRKEFPKAIFVGKKSGEDLVAHYQAADVVVFPSKTDTFGNVNVEAMACGIPVAGFVASGVKDIITKPHLGALNDDLRTACLEALRISQQEGGADLRRNHTETYYPWEVAVNRFVDALAEVGTPGVWDSIGKKKPRSTLFRDQVAGDGVVPAR